MNILSPMATGNGAYIIHKILAEKITNYQLCRYNPYWTLYPPALLFLCRTASSPDIVHTTPDYAWWFRRKGVPLIITFHNYVLDSFIDRYSSWPQRIHYKTDLRYFTKKAIQSADMVTSVSRFTAGLVRKDMGFRGKIKVIYNGIDTEVFRPQKSQSQKKNKIKVLFSGNLTRRKGADLIPRIAKLLEPGIEILCTSGLRNRHQFEEIAITPNIRNIGSIPHYDMPRIYQGADILLFPTIREGFGLAAAEAMACGLPVVTTNCSSLPELIIDGKGGYLCEMGNVEKFSAQINELAASPQLRQEMGEFNRARVEKKFTVDRMVKEYEELFEKVHHGKFT